eukprot:GHVU01029811.1.p3 GENE.GHVU01029811.1~~GHVU01029811.1.p3  ORF type:complete len:151 (+),score=56.81 GHVU01029811.1:365-817(+)
MTSNKIETLGDLLPLETVKELERLSFLDNPVTRCAHYREFLIHLCPKLRYLDFKKISDKERKAAMEKFEGEEGQKLRDSIAPKRQAQAAAGKDGKGGEKEGKPVRTGPSPAEIEKIKEAIGKATTLEEIAVLEKKLRKMETGKEGKENAE